jgi:hypothetical protein
MRVIGARLYFLPIQTRVPLKFGSETLTHVTCARVAVTACDRQGHVTEGWGETPLSVQWVWPSSVAYELRLERLKQLSLRLTEAWPARGTWGHPLEVGHDFLTEVLPELWRAQNLDCPPLEEPMPWLAALLCGASFDVAAHDAYGQLHQRAVYETYGPPFLGRDLASFLEPADATVSFRGQYPCDFLRSERRTRLRAWHLVGGLDPLEPSELKGDESHDGYPVLLPDWIRTDGLTCLKVKLRGNDGAWDYARLVKVGQVALPLGVEWLSADFNCTVRDPAYVAVILDRLQREQADLFARLLYVEQPFPYDLEQHRLEVHALAAR